MARHRKTKKATKRRTRRPASKSAAPKKSRKSRSQPRASKLTELQKIAKKHGIPFGGLSESALRQRIKRYGY